MKGFYPLHSRNSQWYMNRNLLYSSLSMKPAFLDHEHREGKGVNHPTITSRSTVAGFYAPVREEGDAAAPAGRNGSPRSAVGPVD